MLKEKNCKKKHKFVFSTYNGINVDLFYIQNRIIMKLPAFFLISFMIFIALFEVACRSTKHPFQKKPPFSIVEAKIVDWTGGVPHTGGTTLTLSVRDVPPALKPGYIYRGAQKAKVEIKNNSNASLWIGRFPSEPAKNDLNMQEDFRGEYGNSAAVMHENREIPLTKEQVAVSYYYKGKTRYYLIEDLVRQEPVYYPSAPPQKP